MSRVSPAQRNLTPPQIAEQFGVAVEKVIAWIKSGELAALNLANRGCHRPRYSITPDALDAFKRSRQVIPQTVSPTRRVRRKPAATERNYF